MNNDSPDSPDSPPSNPTEPIPDALQQRSQEIDPTGRKVGNRVKNGGSRPNAGIQKGTELSSKRTYPKEFLAQKVTEKIITGKITPSSSGLTLTEHDQRLLARISGVNVEAFNEIIATDLREIAALSAQAIKEALAVRAFKPGELGFIYSVAHDKRLSLDGSRALNNASVNIQVNNFGSSPKDQLLTELDGMTNVSPNPDVRIDSHSSLVKVS